NATGDAFLLAMRLAERGAAFVTVNHGQYDAHSDIFNWYEPKVGPLDQALSALIRHARDRFVVAVVGEFGRSPRVNAKAGRDHHPNANTALITGKGMVYGSTDRLGMAQDDIVSPEKVRKTILALAGHELPANQIIPQIVG